MAHDLGWWLVGKPMVNILFALIELFRYLFRFRGYIMRRNAYISAVFAGVELFALKFTWTGSSPANILGARKLETLGYPVVKTACLCIPSFSHNTGV